jgi:putative tricarboxylic transport membrane protein
MQAATWTRAIARLAVAAAAIGSAGAALALDSVKMMIPAAPGGGWDSTGRALGAALQASGAVKNIQYDNKGGAAGAIGLAQFVNTAKGDPSALLVGGMVMVGGLISSKSPLSLEQVTPIARLTTEYEVIVVPASSPIKSVKELADKMKSNPGSVAWGGGSAGGSDHILVGMIAKATGVDPAKTNYVPFKGGGDAVAAIIGGHVAAGVSGYSEFEQHIKSGKMRALAMSSPTREKGIDIPTLKEQGVDVELANWRGVFGAPGISPAQRDEMIKAVKTATEHASWKKAVEDRLWTEVYLPGEQFGKYIVEDEKRIAQILGDLGMGKK